ncbi:MAG: glycoside hydrolase family 20 zincin-like fold domain-containing protein, partial [Coprobacillus sp.]
MKLLKIKKKKRVLLNLLVTTMVIGLIPVSAVHGKSPRNFEGKQITTADDLLIYPSPRNMTSQDGVYTLQDGKIESDDDNLTALDKVINDASSLANVTLSKGMGQTVVKLQKDESLNEQGYSLKVNENGIGITYKDKEGAYYAATTLYQILWQTKKEIPYLSIDNDYPDFKYRAFDMDISRNRLPSVETAKRVIDLMANLKYNQMFFYLEGFSYAYGSYPQVWDNGDPLTPAQAKELSKYAAKQGIDLIPAQNSFGHSSQWISHNDFQELGDTNGSTTFNVFDTKTQDLLSNIYDDLFTDGFESSYLQVGGDETTLDLTNGRSAADWKKLNPGKEPTQADLYLDSMKIIYDLATKEKNKTMLYWGDMIIHYDLYEQAKKAMPDAIAMDWGYLHDYNFEASTSKLKAADIPYYVCPGDSSWSTIVGNTSVMNENAETAAIAGKKNGALGYAMTNWGDAGHYQNIITTYPAIAYAGGLSWCTDKNMKDKSSYDEFLNMFLYQDSTNTLSQSYSKLADFSSDYLPYGWNGNWIANCMVEPWSDTTHNLWDFMDFQEDGKDNAINERVRDKALAQCDQVAKAASDFLEKLKSVNIQADDADLLNKEFKNTAQMTKIAADYAAMRLRLFTGGGISTALSTKEAEKDKAIASAKEFQVMIEDFKSIWKTRDVYGELPLTLGWISKPAMMYQDIAGVGNIYGPQADGNLFLKTPETIGTGLSVDDFVVDGWTWTNYGTGMPAISNTYMGGQRIGQLKKALQEKVFSISDSMTGVSGEVFA